MPRYILFFREADDAKEEISSLPGVHRIGINKLKTYLDPSVENGLKSVLLFGVLSELPKVSRQIDITPIAISFRCGRNILCWVFYLSNKLIIHPLSRNYLLKIILEFYFSWRNYIGSTILFSFFIFLFIQN